MTTPGTSEPAPSAPTKSAPPKSEKDRVVIFDTTLRDGEQCPGATMTHEEKLEVAELLDEMGVDIIEAGFPIASEGDFAAVNEIARRTKNAVVCGLARAGFKDIDRAGEAIQRNREVPLVECPIRNLFAQASQHRARCFGRGRRAFALHPAPKLWPTQEFVNRGQLPEQLRLGSNRHDERLQGVHIRQQVLNLLIVHHAAEAFHFAAAELDDVAHAIVVRGQAA